MRWSYRIATLFGTPAEQTNGDSPKGKAGRTTRSSGTTPANG